MGNIFTKKSDWILTQSTFNKIKNTDIIKVDEHKFKFVNDDCEYIPNIRKISVYCSNDDKILEYVKVVVLKRQTTIYDWGNMCVFFYVNKKWYISTNFKNNTCYIEKPDDLMYDTWYNISFYVGYSSCFKRSRFEKKRINNRTNKMTQERIHLHRWLVPVKNKEVMVKWSEIVWT